MSSELRCECAYLRIAFEPGVDCGSWDLSFESAIYDCIGLLDGVAQVICWDCIEDYGWCVMLAGEFGISEIFFAFLAVVLLFRSLLGAAGARAYDICWFVTIWAIHKWWDILFIKHWRVEGKCGYLILTDAFWILRNWRNLDFWKLTDFGRNMGLEWWLTDVFCIQKTVGGEEWWVGDGGLW